MPSTPWMDPAFMAAMQNQLENLQDTSAPPARDVSTDGPPQLPPSLARIVRPKRPVVPRAIADFQPSERTMSNEEQFNTMMGQQQREIDAAREAADSFGSRPMQTDLSPLASLVDSWSGTNTAKGYQKPMSAEERQITSAKLKGAVTDDQAKLNQQKLQQLIGGEKNDSSLLKLAALMGRNTASEGAKSDKELNNYIKAFRSDMNTYAKSAGAVGALGISKMRASKLASLIDSIPQGNLNPQELTDLAAGMATMITGQNRTPFELVKDIMPKGLANDAAKLQQYFLSKPKGANMQEFVQRMGNTIKREGDTADLDLHDLRTKMAAGHGMLYDNDRGRREMLRIGKAWGVDPSEIHKIFQTDPETALGPYTELPMSSKEGGFYTEKVQNAGKEVEPKRPSQIPEAEWNVLSPKYKKAAALKFSK